MTHGFEIGALDLVDGWSDDGYELRVLAGGSFGTPEAIVREIVSALADGNHVRYDRAGNRVVTFDVEITAPDGLALAAGEVALRRELYKPNTVTWTPPSDFAPPSVFEVLTSHMAPNFDDIEEMRGRRVFTVTLTCAPFARSAELVTVPALTSSGVPSETVVDTCDSATGWATLGGDTLSQSAGAVWSQDSVGGNNGISLHRAASIDVSAHPYFMLEWKPYPGSGYTIMGMPAAADQFPKELRRTALADGWIRSCWLVAPGDLDSGFQLSYQNTDTTTTAGDSLGIREVSISNMAPGTSPRQLSRIIHTGGTERTPASIHVQSANGTDPLGLTIVASWPDDGSGFSPPLQRWRVSSAARTPDATAYSGNYESINTTSWAAEIPTSSLPEAGYVLMARLRSQDAATVRIHYSTSTLFPDSVTQQGFTIGYVDHQFGAANVWNLVPLEGLTLPSVRTAAGKVQIALQVQSATPIVTLDEAWLFRADDDCAVTLLETSLPHLWLESPDVTSLTPRVWVGDGQDTRIHPGETLDDSGNHTLHPDGTAIFTAAFTDYALTDATFYRRWSNNAAE